MRKFNLNWGVVLAAMVLLAYTYISFLGMLYKVDGVIWKSILFAIGVIAVVAFCVYFMVKAKVTKVKGVGTIGQVGFGFIILVTFLVSGVPFTSFLKVAENQESIEKEIDNVRRLTIGVDSAYNAYAAVRIQQYKQELSSGDELKIQSLHRRLAPNDISSVQTQRKEWASQIGNMSIWNIKLPQNLKYMETCVTDWTKNYMEISNITYDGQLFKPFEYPEFQKSLSALMDGFKHAGYSFWSVIAAVFSALIMLLPYWLAIPTKVRKTKEINYV